MLAVDANQLVRTDVLIDRIWGDQPPQGARRTLHTHVSRVRRLLEQDGPATTSTLATTSTPRVLRRSGGYLLDVDSEHVDLHRFRRLVERAGSASGADDERVTLLREAMGLWRGEPLAGVPGDWAARIREAWRQRYLTAVVNWAWAETGAGNPTAVIGPVTMLVGEYPLVESLVGALMQALYASGRTADALDHYARARRRLVEEIGVEPGAELSATQRAILRGEIVRGEPAPDTTVTGSAAHGPAAALPPGGRLPGSAPRT